MKKDTFRLSQALFAKRRLAGLYKHEDRQILSARLVSCLFHLFICGLLTFYFHQVLYYSKDILITVNFVKEVKFSELQGRNMAFKLCNTVPCCSRLLYGQNLLLRNLVTTLCISELVRSAISSFRMVGKLRLLRPFIWW